MVRTIALTILRTKVVFAAAPASWVSATFCICRHTVPRLISPIRIVVKWKREVWHTCNSYVCSSLIHCCCSVPHIWTLVGGSLFLMRETLFHLDQLELHLSLPLSWQSSWLPWRHFFFDCYSLFMNTLLSRYFLIIITNLLVLWQIIFYTLKIF